MKENPIIVALDNMCTKQALNIAKSLSGMVWGFKVNHLLYNPNIIKYLKKFGNVMADPKTAEIPTITASWVKVYSTFGADIITVHASSGEKSLRAAVAESEKHGSKIFAVTVLTSLDEKECKKIFGQGARTAAFQFSTIASRAGVRGVVSSAHEIIAINTSRETKSMKVATPGIRPDWYRKIKSAEDQERTATPKEAIDKGANYIIMGRAITKGPFSPKEAVEKILKEINF